LVKTQHNARIHLCASIVLFALGFALGISLVEWSWLLAAIGAVWAAEAFNTSFEFLADAVVPEFHPLVRNAKDVAASAVLIVAIISTINIIFIFWPHAMRWVGLGLSD
jgi:diacylglycerol kinase (ATP)